MSSLPRYVIAACRARDLLAELQIQDPEEIVIERIAPFKRAPVRYANLAGCDGQIMRTGDTALITVRSSIDRVGQRRFVIAHELGHVVLHQGIRQVDQVDANQTDNFHHHQKDPAELEANYFAAELLMPKVFFQKDASRLEPSWDNIRALSERYQTTLSSTAIQFVHYSPESVLVVASERGERSWFLFGDGARDFYLNDEQRVHRYTCAHELIAEGKTRSRSADIPAGAWLSGFDPNGKECITEDSMRATGSRFVLSLLWIHEDI